MPTIVMCNTKGGVGKSTIAAVLAQVYAEAGSTVTLIDADPNQPLVGWARQSGEHVPSGIEVVGNVTEETVLDAIAAAESRSAFVIVDLEGSGNMSAAYAVSRADLVLIPMRGKQLDANQAGKVVQFVRQQERAFGRSIPCRIVFSVVPTLASKEERHIRSDLIAQGIDVLNAALPERAAYSAIFQLGGSIYDLTRSDVTAPEKAIAAAQELATAVTQELTRAQAPTATAPMIEEKAYA